MITLPTYLCMKLSMDRFIDEEMRANSELDRLSTMGFFSTTSSFGMDLLGCRYCSDGNEIKGRGRG
jgi:hypothetical protein